MKTCGLVSISFRQHSVEEIIKAAKNAGLSYIEWGSDVHVPQGDAEKAIAVKEMMEQAGLKTSSYGSYYKLGQNQDILPFLETAKLLGTDIIRVWAGTKGSALTSEEERKVLTAEAKEISKKASEFGMKIDFEYHPNTLTDDADSAVKLIREVDEPNCGIYWQPNYQLTEEANLSAAQKVLPYVDVLHVFYWSSDYKRLFMEQGKDEVLKYLKVFKDKDVYKLLEFVPEDKIEYLPKEAEVLYELVREA